MPRIGFLLRLGAALLGLGGGFAADAQTRVENVASLTYGSAGDERTVRSNAVSLDVAAVRRATSVGFRLLPPNFRLRDMKCEGAPIATFTPAPIDAATLAATPPLQALDVDQPLLIVLDAPGSNRSPLARDIAEVDLDSGVAHSIVPLTETGADTGVFAGGIPVGGSDPALAACDLTLQRGAGLKLSFHEDSQSFGSNSSLLIDPAGFLFDSATGALIDGATVSLVDAQGNPATVFGDDGVSRYPSTVVSGQIVTDASGRVYPAQRGRYRFPLTLPGTYHLLVAPPADYSAPSVVTREAIARLRDPQGRAFIINDASYQGALVLATADPFLADIPLDRAPRTSLLLTKTASVREAAPGDFVQYRIALTNRGTSAASDLHLFDTLPAGLRYERGSTRGAAEAIVQANGRNLDFVVPSLAPGATIEVRYVVGVTPGAPAGEALNRVRVIGGTNTSNEASASVRVRGLLFTDAMTVIGRVSEGACGDPAERRKGIAGIRLLLEDGSFVVTDRDGFYHFDGVRSGRHVVQLDTASIPASHQAVACNADSRQARSPISRFVEGDGGLIKRVDFQLRPTGKQAVAAGALPITVDSDTVAAGNRAWVAGQQPGVAMLFPGIDHNPRAPVLRVVIKHRAGQRVLLALNGRAVEPLAFDGTDQDAAATVMIAKWTGLALAPGANRLVARVVDAAGTTVETLERVVTYAGAPVVATVDAARSRLVADGLTRPLIAVRVTDAGGRPVRAGTLVPYTVDQPHSPAQDAALLQARQLAGRSPAATTTQTVGDDGLAFIALQPTAIAGAVRIVVSLADDRQTRTSEIRAWLSAAQQQWTVVGFGAGSVGYETLRRHRSSLPRHARDRVVTDRQLALYAKGRIKGSWLLTIAYDSDRAYDPDRGLLGTIDPDRYYTVYGDGTQQGYDAATRRKLYLRLERRDVYALFGDFETAMTETQLARYSRTLNGVKAAYEGRRVRATGFAAKIDTLYARDEIQGNGLSGPYRLSARGIVPNSDKLRIEVRDRFRSERIISSTQLTRHIDYDIDVVLGTVRFRDPVLTRDSAGNPTFIVVDYETEDGRSDKLAAAARVAVTVGALELGASAIHDQTIGSATIVAADVKARIGRATVLRGEIAQGGRSGIGAGGAFLAELEHRGGGVDLLAYARQQDAGFGVGQQNLVEAGTRKIGLDTRVALADRLSLTATAWYQDMLRGAGQRFAGDARVEYRGTHGTVFVGAQLAADRGLDGRDRDSRLLTLGGSKTLFGGALALAAQTQITPGGDKASVDFPIRHQITAAWRLLPGIRLIAAHGIANGTDYAAHTTQVGFDVAPWTGAKLMSTLNQQAIGENGRRTYAQYGLSQSLPIGKRWSIDATLDANTNVRGSIPLGAVINAFQPVASGGFLGGDQVNGDYAAATFGASYRAERWSWTGRIEYRDGEAQDRVGITSSFLRTLGEGRTLASGLRAFRVEDAAGNVAGYAAADLAFAWRPADSPWSVLERFEFRQESAGAGVGGDVLGVPSGSGTRQATTRLINNLALNYRSGAEGNGHGVEATLYYGAKYIRGRFDDDVYAGYIDVTGFDLRHDLGRRVDIGVAASVQHAWEPGSYAWSGGPSAGVSPAPNVWISAGYNIAGYRDRDFAADRYTRQGPYLTMRLKVDQLSLGAASRALLGGGR